ncbi:hypothetical protein G7074_14645 [Pedobacter sp. HDW13]|uniref:hypothetical protein n=1 Tax=Pedobacter sp. HDW13 TaxID=2714940 RepID=UPI00140A4636|nr:hypothetical protein [Pedobacter sp. HDW13]QIL40392.1 hypothetical protein G7074_14645 [Pedobacter sp. HDW13]
MSSRKAHTIGERKAFLKFLLLFTGKSGASARKRVYQLAEIVQLQAGDHLPAVKLTASVNKIIIVLDGLVSGYVLKASQPRRDIWLGSGRSVFINERLMPGTNYINLEAIENSLILLISQQELEIACNSFPVLDRLFAQFIFPNAIRGLSHHTMLSKIGLPAHKLSYFRKVYPSILDRVPPGYTILL